ncbi:hypothetical protein Htur_1285 [Haloterrigena turkmenica DSM 5511]|uniref:Uncharacterized protein n=1 Tax=Haloterrigena turkmenica (strain ATCC 51198 / DSM 5511 / JCM 9101 / NCIMB 13204 / VKM B-1734 / 4k) TaxID=543526 RepID=D2RPE1_HALTV|nr:hypothetical protein [Haloterrigena turkmenica]ADB60175.1 hypothetical protein Htur_1285 [Haloterrigena turkmenica DSM 5511]
MSGEHVQGGVVDRGIEDLAATALAGLAGGAGFGVALYAFGLLESVGILVGRPGLLSGLSVLLVASVIGAFAYRLLGTVSHLEEDVADPITGLTLGACFGLAVWGLGVALALPLWLRLLGWTPPVPYLHWQSLVALLVYGVLVGPASPLAERYVRF